MNEDSSSARRISTYGPTSSTSFGMKAESTALRLRDDALIDKGTAAPNLCLSSVEYRTLTASNGLLAASTTSTAARHLSPAAFVKLLPDLKYEFWDDINPIRHIQHFLEDEGLRNENKANSGVRSWWLFRSSTRLPVSGRVTRVALWGGFRFDAAVASEARAFLVQGEFEHHFQERPSDSLRRTHCG